MKCYSWPWLNATTIALLVDRLVWFAHNCLMARQMPKYVPREGTHPMKQSIYERITSQVFANLESAGSWQKMWQISPPVSLKGHIYQGINHLLLSCSDYASPVWATFNQVCQNSGSVKKGEKSSLVVFWKRLVNVDVGPDTGKPCQDVSFLLRYYNVFNTVQCEFDDTGQRKSLN